MRLAASALLLVGSAALPVFLHRTPGTTGPLPRVVHRRLHVSLDDFARILIRNQQMAVLAASGLLTGGVTTVSTLSILGFHTAQAAMSAQDRLRLSGAELGALLVPHGVVEVTGFILAGAAGLAGLPLLAAAADGNRMLAVAILRDGARLAGAALGLITIGAVVEVVLTPAFATWVLTR